MTWRDAVDSAHETIDKTELKREVDLRAVLERELGVVFNDYYAPCPFHDDAGEHLSVWGDDLAQVGCWVCEWRGDVFDVISFARGVKFTEALRIARQYRDEGIVADAGAVTGSAVWTAPETWEVILSAAERNAVEDPLPIARFIKEKGLRISTDYLKIEWRVGTRGSSIIIPHYDRDGVPMGYKERTAETVPLSAKGSRFTDLYGSWRNRNAGRVILCEGETDTWTVAWAMRGHHVDVFGLPTGAGTAPRDHLVEFIDRPHVTIAFDNDEAGNRAATRWNDAVKNGHVLKLPNGADCSSLPADQLNRLLKEE